MTYNLAIFCGSSSPKSETLRKEIKSLIDSLSEVNGVNLVYGGAKIGVMGEVAETFLRKNKKVIGVMPRFLKDREVHHESLSEFYETTTMHDRKQKMYDLADGFLILPGGFGTLDELFEISCWSQLDQHAKPICVFNGQGFFNPLEKLLEGMLEDNFITQEHKNIIQFASKALEIRQYLRLG